MEMMVWLALLFPAFLTGFACGHFMKSRGAWLVSGFLPWLGLLVCLLGTVYILPNEDKNASVWPVAQAVGSTTPVLMGLAGCFLARKLNRKFNL